MAITTDVNVNLLNECFELGPFHGLCKPHSDDILKPEEEEETNSNINNNIENEEISKNSHESGKLFNY